MLDLWMQRQQLRDDALRERCHARRVLFTVRESSLQMLLDVERLLHVPPQAELGGHAHSRRQSSTGGNERAPLPPGQAAAKL